MGMYTGLKLKAELKEELIDYWKLPLIILLDCGYLIDMKTVKRWGKNDVEHPMFSNAHIQHMLRHGGPMDSEYPVDSELINNNLRVSCNLKNYYNQIGMFVDWLGPFVKKLDYGFTRYEEYDEASEIKLVDNRLVIIKPEDP